MKNQKNKQKSNKRTNNKEKNENKNGKNENKNGKNQRRAGVSSSLSQYWPRTATPTPARGPPALSCP